MATLTTTVVPSRLRPPLRRFEQAIGISLEEFNQLPRSTRRLLRDVVDELRHVHASRLRRRRLQLRARGPLARRTLRKGGA